MRILKWEVALGVIAVAAVLLAVPLVRADLARFVRLPESMYRGVAIVGFALAAVGLAGVILLLLSLVFSRPSVWSEFRPVSRRNAQAVFELMNRVFGEETPSVRRMIDWQRRNKTVLTAVYSKQLAHGKVTENLVGVFKLIPLTARAVELLELEEKTGATLAAEDIAASSEEPAGLYIGDVLATTARSKGDVLRCLKARVENRPSPAFRIYTRPLTADGARLVRKYNFVPVAIGLSPGSVGRIHKLSSPAPALAAAAQAPR